MKRFFLTTAWLAASLTAAVAADPIPIAKVKWMGHFGGTEAMPHATFCLMARGFFRSPIDEGLETLMREWLLAHPKAMVVPVASHGPTVEADPQSKGIYVWIVDGEKNLNLEMVEKGCFSPETQVIAAGQKLEAPAADYDAFVKKARELGKAAAEKKVGIWKEE